MGGFFKQIFDAQQTFHAHRIGFFTTLMISCLEDYIRGFLAIIRLGWISKASQYFIYS